MKRLMLEIEKIVVLHCDHGPDLIQLHTKGLKPCIWPFDESPTPRFEVARGTGIDYVKENFGIQPEFLDIRAEREKL